MNSEDRSTLAAAGSERDETMMRLFSDYQIARFNEIYYQTLAKQKRRWLTATNLIIALSSSTALVAVLSSAPIGKAALSTLTALAAVASVVVLVLQFDAKASLNEKSALAYGVARERMKRILADIKTHELTEAHLARIEEVHAFELSVAALDEPARKTVKEKAWEQTLEELPSEKAWTVV